MLTQKVNSSITNGIPQIEHHSPSLQQHAIIDKLTTHSYLAKCQAQYLNDKKQSLHSEVLVLGDFAENYQFLIQDEIQSYHWSK